MNLAAESLLWRGQFFE